MGSWRWLDRTWSAALVLKPYRSYTSLFVQLVPDDDFTLWEEDEVRLYRDLLLKSARPKVFLLEATVYPMATTSAWIEAENNRLFHALDLWDGFNLVRSLGAGYQEPWSVSAFLGQLATFWDMNDRDELVVAATGVAGLVLTTGFHQLFENAVVPGGWFRIEWKLKGAGSEEDRQRSWDLKLGYRWYGLPGVGNTAGITLTRQKTEKGSLDLSLGRNSLLAVELQLPAKNPLGGPSRVVLEYGKFFPAGKRLVGVKAGYLYENRSRYDAVAKEFSAEKAILREYYFQPIVIF